MTLLAMQRDFRAFLTDQSDAFAGRVEQDAKAGLAIYHNAYRVQLLDCLRETFEKLHAWLGEDAFIAAAKAHIESTPPSGWTLSVYGEGFDRTLTDLYPADPEVADLAWLEWTLSRAFEGPDAAPLPAAELGALNWDTALITFTPTMRIGKATTNAGAIWSALSRGEHPPAATILPEPAATLVWRQGLTPCFRSIETVEHNAIATLSRGQTFGGLCATLMEEHGHQAGIELAGQLLGQWTREDMIMAVTCST